MTDRHSFIERMGLAAENDGLSRIAGRLFGALILESEPRSLDDLADDLAVSKASISTEARRLVDRGVAERVARAGDRRDYYAHIQDVHAFVVARVDEALRDWAEHGQRDATSSPPVRRGGRQKPATK